MHVFFHVIIIWYNCIAQFETHMRIIRSIVSHLVKLV